MIADQLAFAPPALASFVEIELAEANGLCEQFGHYLGPCHRPFATQSFAFIVGGRAAGVAISASTVSSTVAGYSRRDVVELARLATSERWLTRVMLRLWREVGAPRWSCWPTSAYIAYSKNDRHEGRIYRFDGWERFTTSAGSSGGGTWSAKRAVDSAAGGKKSGWVYRQPELAVNE